MRGDWCCSADCIVCSVCWLLLLQVAAPMVVGMLAFGGKWDSLLGLDPTGMYPIKLADDHSSTAKKVGLVDAQVRLRAMLLYARHRVCHLCKHAMVAWPSGVCASVHLPAMSCIRLRPPAARLVPYPQCGQALLGHAHNAVRPA